LRRAPQLRAVFEKEVMPRPPHAKPPAYLTPSPPVPEPEKVEQSKDDPLGQDPTRYGDWTLKGIAVDF
jgi:hypothetical protein